MTPESITFEQFGKGVISNKNLYFIQAGTQKPGHADIEKTWTIEMRTNKMRKLLCMTTLLVFSATIYAQEEIAHDNFKDRISKAEGDLNKDSLTDMAIVLKSTSGNIERYRLQVFFLKPDGKYKLAITTDKAIEPKSLELDNGEAFTGLAIKKGVLIINNDLLKGHYEHKFRFQNGEFELIGYSITSFDNPDTGSVTDFNLSTGVRLKKITNYDTEKDESTTKNTKENIKIKPLPTLRDFRSNISNLY